MKKLVSLLFVTLLIASVAFAQTSFTANVTGAKSDLDASITKGTVKFEVVGVKGQNDVDFMMNKSVPYKKEIQIVVSLQKANAMVSAALNDGEKDMKWLFRFFLNAGINHVQFEGKTVTTQDFFQPWL